MPFERQHTAWGYGPDHHLALLQLLTGPTRRRTISQLPSGVIPEHWPRRADYSLCEGGGSRASPPPGASGGGTRGSRTPAAPSSSPGSSSTSSSTRASPSP